MGKPFFRYEYKGFGGCDCVCNLEIHQNLVIITEREDNEGTSITNMAEQLATAICQQFGIAPARLIWIEHYPPTMDGRFQMHAESWNLVFFNLRGGGHFDTDPMGFSFSNPRWVHIDQKIVSALRETHQQ